MKKILFAAALLVSTMTNAQKEIPLYDGNVQNAKPCGMKESMPAPGRVQGVTIPTITVFLPEKADSFKAAVLIFPGGGYSRLAMSHEGVDVAKEFNKHGIAAFVVKYRLPNDSCMVLREIGPLMDAEEAIRTVREKAAEFGIDPTKVGILGFSAGGHLASSLGTKFNDVVIQNSRKTVLRPDFMVLGYPVISFTDSLAHGGSRTNLIGKDPSLAKKNEWSTDQQVTAQTPPTFLIHAADDKTVNVQNSIVFYQALLKNKIAAEMHLYQNGGHGFGMNNATTKDKWFPQVIHWMEANKWVKGDVQP